MSLLVSANIRSGQKNRVLRNGMKAGGGSSVPLNALKMATQWNTVANLTYSSNNTGQKRGYAFYIPTLTGGGALTHVGITLDQFKLMSTSTGACLPVGSDAPWQKLCIQANGISVPLTFSGSRTVTVADGASAVLSDLIPATAFGYATSIPNNTLIAVKGYIEWPGAGFLPSNGQRTSGSITNYQIANYDPAVTQPSDTDLVGKYTAVGTAFTQLGGGYLPCVVGRHVNSNAVSVFAVGDSLTIGVGDTGLSPSGYGWFGRMVGLYTNPPASYNSGVSGMGAQGGSTAPELIPYIHLCTTGMVSLGTNGIGKTGNIPPATVMSQIETWAARIRANALPGNIKVGAMKLGNTTTGAFVLADGSDQTIANSWQTGGDKTTLNNLLLVSSLNFTLDIIPTIANPNDDSKWNAPGYTSDGVHCNNFSYPLVAAANKAVAGAAWGIA